jgi:hypothetical protein
VANDQNAFRDMSANAQRSAEQTMKQAQGAMENYFSWFQNSMSGLPWANNNVLDQWKSCIEQNVAVAQDYANKLSKAQDFQDVVQIQAAFMQKQMAVFSEQAKTMAETYTKALTGGMKPPFNMPS